MPYYGPARRRRATLPPGWRSGNPSWPPFSPAPSIKTEIGLPNFPSYPSGHSGFSGAGAAILSYLFPGGAASFGAMRDEAGMSRMYGGIHYRSDIEAGKAQGTRIAGHTLAFAKADGAP